MKYDQMHLKVISKSNILSWIEAGLRSFKAIDNDTDVVTIKIPYSGLNDDKASAMVGVEVYTKKPLREEEVTYRKYGKRL